MKNYLSVLCIFMCFSAGAQNSVEIFAGPNLSSLRGSNEIFRQYNGKLTGFSAGLALRVPIKEGVGLLTGINYERSGSRVNDVSFTDLNGMEMGKGDFLNRIDYLLLPAMVEFSKGTNTRFSVNCGGFISYLVGQHPKVRFSEHDNGGGSDPYLNVESPGNLKNFNMGISAGAGFAHHLKHNLCFTVRLEDHVGLYNISDEPLPGNGFIKTNSLNLCAGLMMNLR